jgi:hypothetical protein
MVVVAVLCACAALVLTQLPAGANAAAVAPAPVTGNATYFSGLGSPYGGCGLPQANLDSQNFVALNVFNTPGNYGSFPRPIPASMSNIIGMFDNGLNCGRYVQVTIGNFCTGTNDGAQNEPFCRNGSWTADKYNGATLNMIVADSCGDSNAWCRDDPNHLDLAQGSLNQFLLNGTPVADMYPNHWNNRQISWKFVPAPNYTGDIQIGFIQGAQSFWGAAAFSHLPNGIHSVQYFAGGTWQTAQMDSDLGQDYILSPTVAGGTQFQVRLTDASDQPVNNGAVYTFSLPASCGSQCTAAYTQVTYTTSGGGTTTAPPTTAPTTTARPTTAPPTTTPPRTTVPPTTVPPTTTPPSGAKCAATVSVVSSWQGGYQATVTVKNTSTAGITGWTTGFTLPAGETIASSWNSVVTTSGQQISAANASYNGTIAAAGNTTWGFNVNGPSTPPATVTCAAH